MHTHTYTLQTDRHTHTHTHTHRHSHIRARKYYKHKYRHTLTHTGTCSLTHKHTHVRAQALTTHAHTHTHTHILTHTYTHIQTRTDKHTYKRTCIHTLAHAHGHTLTVVSDRARIKLLRWRHCLKYSQAQNQTKGNVFCSDWVLAQNWPGLASAQWVQSRKLGDFAIRRSTRPDYSSVQRATLTQSTGGCPLGLSTLKGSSCFVLASNSLSNGHTNQNVLDVKLVSSALKAVPMYASRLRSGGGGLGWRRLHFHAPPEPG